MTPDIAEVKDGVVTAKGSGMAVIKAEADDGRTVECTVYVDADVPTLPPDTDVDDPNLFKLDSGSGVVSVRR